MVETDSPIAMLFNHRQAFGLPMVFSGRIELLFSLPIVPPSDYARLFS